VVVSRLFVYGTLLPGHAARSMIADHVHDVASATTTGKLFVLPQGFPVLVDDGAAPVQGEVLMLSNLGSALSLTDEYEGELFQRITKTVVMSSGQQVSAWCYVPRDLSVIAEGLFLDHGDWIRYRRNS
jgi:gamma-glutamylcyclotransferase (GGCT)/AIG2-like uncharacterized protein YtfP